MKTGVIMQTVIYKPNIEGIEAAAGILKNGGLVGIPTETVYGLAANALDGPAVSKIFKVKGRPQDNPLIVHISELGQLSPLVLEVPENAIKLANAFWPGPLTIILRKSEIIPDEVSAGLETVAVRMPSHPVARKIISHSGVPLAAPSANLSGSPSPTTALHVYNDLNGKIPAIVDGGKCAVGLESTVITLDEEVPRILRPGGITPEKLEKVLGKIEIDDAVLNLLREGEKAASPGMKYRHYSPKAEVTIVKGSLEQFISFISNYKGEGTAVLCFDGEEELIPAKCIAYGKIDNPEQQAYRLFGALRELDNIGAKRVFARCPKAQGVGLAVYNRLLRAAGFKVIGL
jgi:L-threonylcarbamoyladenylate synthase